MGRLVTAHVVPFQLSTSGCTAGPVPVPVLSKRACSPVATHEVAPKQSTPVSSAGPPDGVGVVDHVDPFHCWISPDAMPVGTVGVVGVTEKLTPTAVHSDGFAHDTPKLSPIAVGIVAGDAVLQLDPFQRRANVPMSMSTVVDVVVVPEMASMSPVVMQKVGLVHDTPSANRAVPNGEGSRVVDQVVPSHRSTTVVTDRAVSVNDVPTATHESVLGQDTELRYSIGTVCVVLGTGDQDEPFHCSMSGMLPVAPTMGVNTGGVVVENGNWAPTAMQNDGPVQDTEARLLLVAPVGAGTGVAVQCPPARTAAIAVTDVLEYVEPTAMQLDGEPQDTPLSIFRDPAPNVGVMSSDHCAGVITAGPDPPVDAPC